MKLNFKKIIKALNPEPAIGGLEISEGALRYVVLNEDKSVARHALTPLAPGIVRGGRVADHAGFEIACRALRAQVARRGEETPVVISLTPAPIYAQVFSLPLLTTERLEEAARLNLRMISPIDFDTAYVDWQMIGTDGEEGVRNQHDALGAFIESSVIDLYVSCVRRAGFLPAAIEFAPLSLARVVQESSDLDQREPYAVMSLGADGVILLVLRAGSLYFTKFLEWSAFGDAPVAVSHFQSLVGSELKRLLHFYTNKWGGAIHKVLVVNITSNKQLAEWIKKEFSLEVFSLVGYHIMDRTWIIAVGAALRGLIPRVDDRYISLARVGTEETVVQNRVWRFIALWRTVAFTVMAVSIAAFAFADFMLVRVERSVRARAEQAAGLAVPGDAASLEAQAKHFNALVAKAARAKEQAQPRSGMARNIYAAADETQAVLISVQLDVARNIIVINGTAPHEQGVIAFKNALANNAAIAAVELPLSSIIAIPSGRAAFTATITVK